MSKREPKIPPELPDPAPTPRGGIGEEGFFSMQRRSFVRMRAESPVVEVPEIDPTYAEPATLRVPRASGMPPFRELLSNDHLNLTVNILHLRRLIDGQAPHPFAGAARRLVADRLGELDDVRDAVEGLLAFSEESMGRMLLPDAPLAVYLRGLFLFCEGFVEALEDILAASEQLHLDWQAFHARVREASHFFFDGLAHSVRVELAQMDAPPALGEQLDELFFAASFLHAQIGAKILHAP